MVQYLGDVALILYSFLNPFRVGVPKLHHGIITEARSGDSKLLTMFNVQCCLQW